MTSNHNMLGFTDEMPGITGDVQLVTPAQEQLESFRMRAQRRLDTASNVRAVLDTIPGNGDDNIADFVDATYEHASDVGTPGAYDEAIVADIVAAEIIVEGRNDIEHTAIALGRQPDSLLGEALSSMIEIEGPDSARMVIKAINKTADEGISDNRGDGIDSQPGVIPGYTIDKMTDPDGVERIIFTINTSEGARAIVFNDRLSMGHELDGVEALPANAHGALELARILNPSQSIELHNISENMKEGDLGIRETAVLDMVACSIIPKGSDREVQEVVARGIVEAARAIAGDQSSLNRVRDNMDWLVENQTDSVFAQIPRYARPGALTVKELRSTEMTLLAIEADTRVPESTIEKAGGMLLVRRTNNYREINSGGIEFRSPASLTRNTEDFVARDTVHWSINNLTLPHGMGVSPAGDIIITPLRSALKANGTPENIAPTDVIYTTSPGEKVYLPDSTIISTGETTNGRLIEYAPDRITVMANGYDQNSVDDFISQFGEIYNDDPRIPKGRLQEVRLLEYAMSYYEMNVAPLSSDFARGILGSADLWTGLQAITVNEVEGDRAALIDSMVRESIMRFMVESEVLKAGGEVLDIEGNGAYAINENDTTRRIKGIADDLGISSVSHGKTVEGKFEMVIHEYLLSDSPTVGDKLARELEGYHPYKQLRNMVFSIELPVSRREAQTRGDSTPQTNDSWV